MPVDYTPTELKRKQKLVANLFKSIKLISASAPESYTSRLAY
jgi:hypothetical protein